MHSLHLSKWIIRMLVILGLIILAMLITGTALNVNQGFHASHISR